MINRVVLVGRLTILSYAIRLMVLRLQDLQLL